MGRFWTEDFKGDKMRIGRWVLVLVVAVMAAPHGLAAENAAGSAEAAERLIVEGNNMFALELYAKLRSQGGNLFVSPYSISTALAMAHGGARGRTASQMAQVLHFPAIAEPSSPGSDQRQFASAYGQIIKDLNKRGQKGAYTLNVANALWGQKGYGFLKQFVELVRADYDGRLNEVDFVGAAEAARKTINTWVEKQTKGKIKDLIPAGVLDSMTRLVLTNAIYFKGNWARQFKKDQTQDAPFVLADGRRIETAMMNQTAEFGYMETETLQGLELPYVDKELSMVVLLPRQPDGLSKLEQALTAENLSQWLGRLYSREVVVSVPKFKVTTQFSLGSVLQSMGMTDAFSDSADFSGMDGKKDLFISAVIHKAYVDVNEEGTEAAAATGVVMRLTSLGPNETPVFRADHPFLFLIRDNKSGGILFIGRVMDPKA
jgi:serpin B